MELNEKVLEERKKEILRLAEIAYTTARFNGKDFVGDYHEPDDYRYSPDFFTDGRYEYEVIDRDSKGMRISTNFITVSKGYTVKWSKGKRKHSSDTKKYEINEVIKDEQLYNELSKILKAPLFRYHFKADDIISGKVYTLCPSKNSNVSKYIEEFLFRFSEALKEGIPAICKVWVTCGPGHSIESVEKVKISWNSWDRTYVARFENHLLGEETKEFWLERVLEAIDLKVIASRPLNTIPNIKNNSILCSFIQELVPDLLAEWTKCLGPEATMDDFCEVIKFYSSFGYHVEEDFVYDPEKSFAPEIRQRINELNDKLEGRGKLFENRTISQSINK